jgi:hypothetical protein
MGNKTYNNLWVINAIAEGTDFKDRILSILNPTARRGSPQRMHFRAVIIIALLFLLPFGAFSPWAAADISPGESSPTLATPDSGHIDENNKSGENTVKKSEETSQNTGDQNKAQLYLFLELLKSPSASVREHAASALGEWGDHQAVPALIKALRDEDAVVREHVAAALGTLGDKRAVRPLTNALQKEQNHNVQVHILSALKKLH